MNISQKNSEALKNPWVLGMLVFLVVFLSANAVFIYMAFKSAPDLVVADFYERGKSYEKAQERIAQEKLLGWSGLIMVPKATRVNQAQNYQVLIHGKNSVALQLDSVILYAYRPSDSQADFSIEMSQQSVGVYANDVSFKLPGIWDLIVEAKQGEKQFSVTKRITINP